MSTHAMRHRVEKIGGASMLDMDAVLDNIVLRPPVSQRYNRIVVVSACQGITDALLECPHTHTPGVFHHLLAFSKTWERALDTVLERLLLINDNVFADPMLRRRADRFIEQRVSRTRAWVRTQLSVLPHRPHAEHRGWRAIRARLAAIGEAHSAFNTALKVQRQGVRTRLVEIAGEPTSERPCLTHQITAAMQEWDLQRELPIVTGDPSLPPTGPAHADRRYADVTLGRVAAITRADHAVVYKAHPLSTADPNVVEGTRPLGRVSHQTAEQWSSWTQAALHPDAVKRCREHDIDLHVKCTFAPEAPSTVFTHDIDEAHRSPVAVTGQEGVYAIWVAPPVNQARLANLQAGLDSDTTIVHQAQDANGLSLYLAGPSSVSSRCFAELLRRAPQARITHARVSLVTVLSDSVTGSALLASGLRALKAQGIEVLRRHHRANSAQFSIRCSQYQAAVCALHGALSQR
ncbi:aspartate kinase [Vibrio coralliilyticus]|uniref:amino acid kinase family protein n=1 Tax=Vibrio coralliilyticus TaxID=190893 RepID=UPI000C165655|nr:aspartate kinase [Vibrio coralliilyticus]